MRRATPLILLVGASGSGKSTISDIFVNEFGLDAVQSYTTRPPRTPDENDRPYIVVLIQANPDVCYNRMINRGDSPEYAKSRIDHDDYIYYNPNKPIECDIKVSSLYTTPETLAVCILALVGYPLTVGRKSNSNSGRYIWFDSSISNV